ncbi:SMEK domain-containing protein [Luteolibacter flavescens]|uniref:SMEK domain-containing protein n=1 Tax=Luteolibacter flavescens TaxID=1859460 RepID=A0ABT3FS43_9BACT|nr:SMEK domain-containing protein [Luteolibacter flavescens]MCW1886407.1 SMEK domain-containing protein [Luteolibacter flavescens]
MALPRLDYATSIGDQLSELAEVIKTRSRAGLTDGNKILEPIMRKTFNELFGWNLINLNGNQTNYPAADLGDRERRIAIQVTNEERSEKISRTAKKAEEHNLHDEFDRLIVFFLLAKKPGLPKDLTSTCGPIIETWDNSDVVKMASEIDDLNAIRRASEILRAEMQNSRFELTPRPVSLTGSATSTKFDHGTYGLSGETECLFSSFFPVHFPGAIQRAKITLKRGIRLSDRIEAAWESMGMKGPTPMDYFIELGTVYTFESWEKPLWQALISSKAIKPESSFSAGDWSCSSALAKRNLFSKLLHRNLEHLCKNIGTEFELVRSRQLKCFLFQAKQGVESGKLKVEAIKKAGTREVFKTIPNTLPGREGDIQHWKHQGFRHQFVTFGGNWFLNIEPFWAFTSDGMGSQSRMHGSSSRNMKKIERNRTVLGHVMFWAAILCKVPDMFDPPALIRLDRPAPIRVSPSISDVAWKTIAPDDEKRILVADGEQELFFA